MRILKNISSTSFICLISNLKIPKITSVKSGGSPSRGRKKEVKRRNKIYLELFHHRLRSPGWSRPSLSPSGLSEGHCGDPWSRLPKGDSLPRQIPSLATRAAPPGRLDQRSELTPPPCCRLYRYRTHRTRRLLVSQGNDGYPKESRLREGESSAQL